MANKTLSNDPPSPQNTILKDTSLVDQQALNRKSKDESTANINSKELDLLTDKIENKREVNSVEKRKKVSTENVEVLANRSWITNFYHNYMKAIASANLHPQKARRDEKTDRNVLSNSKDANSQDMPQGSRSTLELHSFPFNSVLFSKPKELKAVNLSNFKLDTAVYDAFKSIVLNVKSSLKTPLAAATPNSQDSKQTLQLQDIPFGQFEKLGISKRDLLRKGILDRLIKGERTLPLSSLRIKNCKGDFFDFSATFQLAKMPEGKIKLKIHYLSTSPSLPIPDKIVGHRINTAMKIELQEKGIVPLVREPIWGSVQSLLMIDNLRNTIQIRNIEQRRIPMEVKGINLNEKQEQQLREGKEINLSGLRAKDGTSFNATAKWDVEKKILRFSNAYPQLTHKERLSLKDQQLTSKAEAKRVDLPEARDNVQKDDRLHQSKGLRR